MVKILNDLNGKCSDTRAIDCFKHPIKFFSFSCMKYLSSKYAHVIREHKAWVLHDAYFSSLFEMRRLRKPIANRFNISVRLYNGNPDLQLVELVTRCAQYAPCKCRPSD